MSEVPVVSDETPADPPHDRWQWRRRVLANPHLHLLYKILVGAAGVAVITTGLVLGPLPGPGGTPLVLLGLAILASEFEWAHRLTRLFVDFLRRTRTWNGWQQLAFWLSVSVAYGLVMYAVFVVTGLPSWLPDAVESPLRRLPGLD